MWFSVGILHLNGDKITDKACARHFERSRETCEGFRSNKRPRAFSTPLEMTTSQLIPNLN
jgi:hypothetical protein